MRVSALRPLRRSATRAARLSIAKQVLLLQLTVAVLLTAAGVVTAVAQARSSDFDHARAETLALAETIASAPGTAQDVQSTDPSKQLQDTMLAIQQQTSVDFVVVMSPTGVRYTHPNPDEIGKHYLGDTAQALAGHPFSEVYTGTLGPSVRSVAPIYGGTKGEDHKIVGLVSVGITLDQLSTLTSRQLPLILAIALGAVALVGLGSWALSRRLRKQTLGMGPQEITRLYEHHDAVLHAMHEGLLVLDRRHRVLLANDEAVRLLDLGRTPAPDATAIPDPPASANKNADPVTTPRPAKGANSAPDKAAGAVPPAGKYPGSGAAAAGTPVLGGSASPFSFDDAAVGPLSSPAGRSSSPDPTGRAVSELDLDPALAALLASGRDAHDETHLAGTRVLAVNQSKAVRDGRELGTVVTLRDHTELRALAGELDSARAFADALSASAHEAANRLHTVVTLIELDRPQDAVRFATTGLAASQSLIDRLLGAVGDEAVAALLLGKISQAAERGVEVTVGEDTSAHDLPLPTRDLITILGNLIDNAVDAAAASSAPHRVAVSVCGSGLPEGDDVAEHPGSRAEHGSAAGPSGGLMVRVTDSGAGIEPELADEMFTRGWTTKNEAGHGIGLALVRRAVHGNGGSIEVAADPVLGGAAVTVRLPGRVSSTAGGAKANTSAAGARADATEVGERASGSVAEVAAHGSGAAPFHGKSDSAVVQGGLEEGGR